MSDFVSNPIFWILVYAALAGVLTLTFLWGKWVGKVNSFIQTVTKFVEDFRSDMQGLRSDFKDMQQNLSDVHGDLADLRIDVTEIRGEVTHLRSDVNDLRIESKALRTDLNEVRADVNGIKSKLSGMGEAINAMFTRVQASPTSGGSPLQLTKLGEEISQLLAADEWAKSAAPALVASVSGMRPFEIQEFCSDFLRSNYSATSDQGMKVRACAYEYALTRSEVLNVLMVELRDELFRLLGDEHFDRKFDLTLAVT